MKKPDKINILIVDDHRILVEGLKKLFDNSEIIQVAGTAYTGMECRSILSKKIPDVILLDISLPDVSGIDLCKEIKTQYPEIAEKMYLGVETINSYRKNLLIKMGARNTALLVRMALEQKLV